MHVCHYFYASRRLRLAPPFIAYYVRTHFCTILTTKIYFVTLLSQLFPDSCMLYFLVYWGFDDTSTRHSSSFSEHGPVINAVLNILAINFADDKLIVQRYMNYLLSLNRAFSRTSLEIAIDK